MPVTPFHFGPGFFIKSILPRRFSFKAFVLANIVTDFEPIYFLLTNQWPVHRFCHTYAGAALVAVLCMLIGRLLWRKDQKVVMAAGALTGTFSHVFLDSFMHTDLQPFFPLTNINPLLHAVSYSYLHLFCVMLGVLGGVVFYLNKSHQNP